jgi:GNAT superfamily N-acetyltransferase
VGVVRLAFDNETCFLRDLQVIKSAQNKGIGAQTIEKVKQLALASNVHSVRLKVFKVSPAQHLYQRQGFSIINEDERFFYMHSLVS